VNTLDETALAEAAERRFRSEYDYARWEYLRSPGAHALARAGVTLRGRVLDAGCGGGTAPSLAEEAGSRWTDLDARFRGTGTRLAQERRVRATFVQGDGQRLPFRDGSFDVVFSHSVIEHVGSAESYLRECHRAARGRRAVPVHAPFLRWPARTCRGCARPCPSTCCWAGGARSASSASWPATRPGC
jgi:2-polyprenyl-3-methyl-5-hydroxy-6-metoxy-1,4-benzoquinol methylase